MIGIAMFAAVAMAGLAAYLYMPVCLPGPYSGAAKTIGDIPAPRGYERISGDDANYSEFMRSIPLREGDRKVHFFKDGTIAPVSTAIAYAVVDIPLLSNNEQCADACMHMRSEYLYRTGQYGRIRFSDNNGVVLSYLGGRSRSAFESYMRSVYCVANTSSLVRELPSRNLKDIQPGDIFVYKVRPGRKYGHAVMVMDVVENPKTGKRMALLAEGCTPAVEIHVLRNGSRHSPWFAIDPDAETFRLSVFTLHKDELRRFK